MKMIAPSVDELTHQNKYNRYTLVIAVAKCARMVTDEYVSQRETAERMLANKETDKSLAALIKKDFRDEKAVRIGINRLHGGEYRIDDNSIDTSISY
jgi:4-hydroxy-3-methylbut-2-en-1-yl diphosphate synthase IspG/GcpE